MFTWQTSKIANQVSEASQAFAQKVYRDQLVMGAPSISVVSGETVISGYEKYDSYSDAKPTPKYAANVVLRNTGQRDAKRVWVELVSENRSFSNPYEPYGQGPKPQLVSLPRDVDISVRFELDEDPETGPYATGWFVGYVYADETPADQANVPTESSSSNAALAVSCSAVQMTHLTSWPKDPNQDPKVRTLSSGSPVAVGSPQSPNFIPADLFASKALAQAVADDGSCPSGSIH
jgi:hypothetical protein